MRATVELYLFLAICFLDDGAPRPKIVENRQKKKNCMILVVYLGYGVFHRVAAVLFFSKSVFGRGLTLPS